MRIRVTFAKNGPLRYIGHLDLQHLWERVCRRAGLPLAYSHGFHPQPKIQIASALPLGFIGHQEMVDLWIEAGSEEIDSLRRKISNGELALLLQEASPSGLHIRAFEEVDPRAPALQTQVIAAEYEVKLIQPIADLEPRLEALLASPTLPRQRRGRLYDLRPLIWQLSLRDQVLYMTLSAREGATGRPEEVLAALGLAPENARIERKRLILKADQETLNDKHPNSSKGVKDE